MASLNNPIIWVHGDNLNPHSPALTNHPDAPAVWVWDDAYLRQANFSLKRILFIYECLLELPVTIFRGDVVAEVVAFAQAQQRQTIVTMGSPSPGFARICNQLRDQDFHLHIYEEAPFVTLPDPVDIRRFSRYWRQAQPQLKQVQR